MVFAEVIYINIAFIGIYLKLYNQARFKVRETLVSIKSNYTCNLVLIFDKLV